jgi:hypothetical protein
VGILGFFMMIGGFVALMMISALKNLRFFSGDLLLQEAPIWTLVFLLGLALMFLGPIYYWIIESIRKRD